ncbi:VOC family protein [Streptomyces sp. HM190]|uniref:VOC family protein n=1 Tax=Streptomyces sp. HM190 TaxID=2695266 RepID=UPI001357253F|nr:VOC family protein [Streptomyces sp. HM190]
MLTSLCPVIRTIRIKESRAFYSDLFGFEVTEETDWYVGLGRPGPAPRELLLVDPTHPALPAALRRPMNLVRFTVEVEGGHKELARVAACAAPAGARRSGTDGPEGDDVLVTDPNGVKIRVIAPE